MKTKIEDKIFASIISHCTEMAGNPMENPHLFAHTLSICVAEALLPKQQKRIYDLLTDHPARVGTLAKQLQMPSRSVASQLRQIYSNTNLISFQTNRRYKLWYRAYDTGNTQRVLSQNAVEEKHKR